MLYLEPSFVRTLLKVDKKYLDSLEMRCWRRMKKMCWTDHVKNKCYIGSRGKGISYVQ